MSDLHGACMPTCACTWRREVSLQEYCQKTASHDGPGNSLKAGGSKSNLLLCGEALMWVGLLLCGLFHISPHTFTVAALRSLALFLLLLCEELSSQAMPAACSAPRLLTCLLLLNCSASSTLIWLMPSMIKHRALHALGVATLVAWGCLSPESRG